jgi:hypothetical protein
MRELCRKSSNPLKQTRLVCARANPLKQGCRMTPDQSIH